MNYFKNNRIITVIVVFVLVINISALATLLFMRFKEPKPALRGPRGGELQRTTQILKEELQFTEEQVDSFILLENEFLKKDELLRQQEIKLKSELIGSLINDYEINADSSISMIAANVAEREKSTFVFFTALKNMCSEDQQEGFYHLMGMFLRRLNPEHRPPEDGQRPPGMHPNRPPRPEGKSGERPPRFSS